MRKTQGPYIIGVDTGGTFTDAIIVDGTGKLVIGKALTTYADLKQGVLGALQVAAEELDLSLDDILRDTIFFGHGTTLGTNAVINRHFGKVGLITTMGHEDVTLIMRAAGRTDGLNELDIRHQAICRKPVPIVPRTLIKGVVERVDCFGNEIIPLDLAQAKGAVEELLAQEVEAIAVCLLWSFVEPRHEQAIKDLILSLNPDMYVAVSSEIAPQIREYARSMTVIIEAAIGKLMQGYLSTLNAELIKRGLKRPVSIMQAHGGVISSIKAKAVSTINSGPVGGLIGGTYFGKMLGTKNIINTDVGGTSFDVSVWADGVAFSAREPLIDRYRVSIPMLEINCIGAGGSTIARVEPFTKTLQLGPESAGSSPGPVCYNLGGTEPTVTDADLLLGYLNPDYFYGGRMRLNKMKAEEAIEQRIAKPLGMDTIEAAAAIYDIINSHMADNLRLSVVGKGYDPKQFILLAFGGNGPMHVASYAKELGVLKAYIPFSAAAFSAFGIASSDLVNFHKFSELHNLPVDPEVINTRFGAMQQRAIEEMREEGVRPKEIIFARELDLRYARQVHEVTIPVKQGKMNAGDLGKIVKAWEKRYETLFGKGAAYREAGIQIVSFRLSAIHTLPKPKFKQTHARPVKDSSKAIKDKRPVFFREYRGFKKTDIYDFNKLRFGNEIKGPAIIETPLTTVVVLPNQEVSVDKLSNLVFEKL